MDDRRAAHELVANYHDSCIADLLAHVATAIDDYRDATRNAAETDAVIHQYHRATQELWKFCYTLGDIESVAATIQGLPAPIDWWQRGKPRRPAR